MKIRTTVAITLCSGMLAACSSGSNATTGGPVTASVTPVAPAAGQPAAAQPAAQQGAAAQPATPATGQGLAGSASGRMLAVRLPSTVNVGTNSYTNLPSHSATATSALASERSAATGMAFNIAAEEDPSRTAQGPMQPALVSLSSSESLSGGAKLAGLNKAPGSVYFENGNFGDPQVESGEAAVSSVGVYNKYENGQFQKQLVLTDVTTIRYRDGADGATAANYGVGYAGNPTQNMPGSGTATYEAFLEQGTSVYTKADGSIGQFGFDRNPTVALQADFGAGTVTGGVSNSQLVSYEGGTMTTLNNDVSGLAIDAKIQGSEYSGTAAFVDSTGKTVGTVAEGAAIGGFFGADARETAAAVSVEGNAQLGGNSSDYVYQAVIGGVKQ